uniref:Sarcoplasmic calcium-binding proteins II, V, VI, and VII n=3 Tax=Cacopsylla melanoneura TaxID=428564 RepID=A0A8D8M3V7_9HEMI
MVLSVVQQDKLRYFFDQLLDGDHDELVCYNDFQNLAERIRRFAEWSESCGEYFVVEQIRIGFLDTFISSKREEDNSNLEMEKIYIDQDHWLKMWNQLIRGAESLNSFPLWIQYFPRILFQAINKSGSGLVSKEELRQFLFYIVGLDSKCVDSEVDTIYNVLTANGDTGLDFHVFQLSFINFLLGRNPNGPGQYLFGPCAGFPDTFPVDYSALNADQSIEHYSPSRRSNRSSVIV